MGYGDKVPVTILGRAIACLWMITGVILFGVFNGAIVKGMSYVTPLQRLSGPLDQRLQSMQICTTDGAFQNYLPYYNISANTEFANNFTICLDNFVNKKVFCHGIPFPFHSPLSSLSRPSLSCLLPACIHPPPPFFNTRTI